MRVYPDERIDGQASSGLARRSITTSIIDQTRALTLHLIWYFFDIKSQEYNIDRFAGISTIVHIDCVY